MASDPGTAAAFDGSSATVSVPASSALNVGDVLSVEGWVKRATVGTSGYQTILSEGGTWSLAFDASDHLVLLAGATPVVASTVAVADTSSWHEVAVTKSGSGVHLYIDGSDVTGTVSNATLAAGNGPVTIAANGSSAFFEGSLEEVALYGSALTAGQVSSHYATGVVPNLTAPSISGTATDGRMLSAGQGSWGGSPTSYAYQWQACNSTGGACATISGATAATLVLSSSNVGATIRVLVTAANAKASNNAISTPTGVVAAAAPSNTTGPAVSGTAKDGQTLSASNGSWSGTGPLTYADQWQRCDAAGANCTAISGASAGTYHAVSADVGSTLRAQVTASNAGGSASATSPQTGVVAATAPASTTLPAISGTAKDGQTLSASTGSWSGTTPLSFAYQWQRCNSSGASCASIAGQTSASHLVTAADIASTLRVVVTASNTAGSAPATSAASAVVTAAAPANTTLPGTSGTLSDGKTLTASTGTWSGTAPITYTYQWQRCSSSGTGCANISAATAQTYQLAPGDVNHTLQVIVKATNSAAAVTATSAVSGVVAAAPAPTITSVTHSNLPSGSVYGGTDSVTVTATSTGPGVKELKITDATGAIVADYKSTCAGTGASPCPASLTKTLIVDYTKLALGRDTLSLVAIDPATKTSTATTWTVTDVTPPSCSDTWTGNAGDGAWETAGNWSAGTVPGDHDYACIPAGATVQITSSDTVGRLQDSGTLEIAGGSLSIDDASAISTAAGSVRGTVWA